MKLRKVLSLSVILALALASASSAVVLSEIKPQPFDDKGVSLKASLVEFADPVEEENSFGVTGSAWRDGRLYMLHQNGNIDCYALEGNFLIRDPQAFGGKGTIKLGRKMDILEMDAQGTMYVSSGTNQSIFIVGLDGSVKEVKDGKNRNGRMAIHPSGEWGIRMPSGSPLRRMDLVKAKAGEAEFSEVMPLPSTKKGSESTSFRMFNFVRINEDGSLFVSGLSHKVKGQGVWGVLDTNYNEVFAFLETLQPKDPKCIGNVGDIITCKQGYAVLDNNMRRLHIYGTDFSYITTAMLKDFLGLTYCWPTRALRIDDNTVLITCTQEFPKNTKCYEAVIMKVEGL